MKKLNLLYKHKFLLISIFILLLILLVILTSKSSKELVIKMLKKCDIVVNGTRDQDIIVKNDKFYSMILIDGDLGLGESYMYGYWDSKNLLLTLETLLANWKEAYSYKYLSFSDITSFINHKILNYQTISSAKKNAVHAYNIGNDLYTRMLDNNMQYSCGYWQDTNNLNIAQEQKLTLIGQKLNLQPGDKVLDIGCGWGGLANFLSNKFNVSVMGVSLAEEQIKYAKSKFRDNKNVEFKVIDYRNLPSDLQFDKIVSVGMFEHVGQKNYEEYFNFVYKYLKPRGLALIHTIGAQGSFSGSSLFIDKYIFPGIHIPEWNEVSQIVSRKFVIHDWHNFSKYYNKTLIAWDNNIKERWNEIPNYNDEFKRMFSFYLLGCAANFGNCNLSLWQILLSKGCPEKLPRRDCLIKY